MNARSRLLAALTATACLAATALAPSASAAGTTAWAPIAASGPTNLPPKQSEIQRIGVDAGGGTFALTFEGQTTAPIAFDAEASEVQAKLNALSTIGADGVGVIGGPGNKNQEHPYFVTFEGPGLAETNVNQISADASLLTGGSNHSALATTNLQGGPGTTTIIVYAQNVGGKESSAPLDYEVTLPPGIVTTATPTFPPNSAGVESGTCSPGAGQSVVTCTYTAAVGPGFAGDPLRIPVKTEATVPSTGMVEVEVEGGGAPLPATYQMPLTVSDIPAPPGVQSVIGAPYDENGVKDTRAGSHPYSGSTAFFTNSRRAPNGRVVPSGEYKDVLADLPPGTLGNPIAVPQCPDSIEPPTPEEGSPGCPLDTGVGTVQTVFGGGRWGENAPSGKELLVYNIEAPYGSPAKAKFFISGLASILINVIGELRSDQDYGVTFGSRDTPQIEPVWGAIFTFWGSPADSEHTNQRCDNPEQKKNCKPSTVKEVAFFTNPVSCAEQAVVAPIVTLRTNTWQNPGEIFSAITGIDPVTECENLEFDADFKFEPSETKSDSTASFRTELTVPSEGLTHPDKLTTPEIRETVVKLPEGVSLNPSGADGLEACSLEQIGFKGKSFPAPNPIRFTRDPNRCPEASKIGTGEVKTALLEETLHGALYLAAQGEGNPYGSLFAVYLVVENIERGIFIKLPGEVEPDKATGQFQVTFRDLPQLPFTSVKLNLKGGNRSALASPVTCGNFVTSAVNTPWSYPDSGPPTTSANGFEINQGPNGAPCAPTKADRPFNVGLSAGTDSVAAGAFSPLTFHITRPDGSQEIEGLELKSAPGLSASLKGIPSCSEEAIDRAAHSTGRAELANSACPQASRIGRTVVGAGAGPTPFYSDGNLYLAGPYKGAPLSVVAITPAVAGPFDLGSVVVRTAVHINRSSAQVTAKTDPIPQILEGVPLRIKDVRVILDRPSFSLNPTSCDPNAIEVKATGNSGAVANLSSRFQVAGCERLDFKPKFAAKVIGGTKRGDHPAFSAEVTWPQGAYANTKDVSVTLPRSEFLDQANIRTICTRVQAAADTCPPGSIYGEAEAITPLLDEPLKGPVYLKSSDNKLPDLAIKLKGPASKPVEVEFQGRIDSIKGRIRDTIEGLPDVPVTKFVLRMQGGRKGLLVNSRNLCSAKKGRMDVRVLGHNNKRADQKPLLQNSCKKSKKRKGKKTKRHGQSNGR